jgi:hypothetical protein
MGWAVRIAPGVRVALTPRGVRTSVGPRGARVHFGAGRPTISTGAGAVTLWTPVGRSATGHTPTRSVAAHERAVRAAARQRQHTDAVEQERAFAEEFLRAHTLPVSAAQPPVVPEPAAVDVRALEHERIEQALAPIAFFHHHERSRARERARAQAAAEAERRTAQAQADHQAEQRRADQQWQALCANEPATVIATLEASFEHLQLPAAPLDCTDAHVTVALRFPEAEGVVPARRPQLTPTGRPTSRPRSKSELAHLYFEAVLSHALLTGRLALAACPGLAQASVIVFRGGGSATAPICPICVIVLDRPTVQRIDWGAAGDAGTVALSFERLALLTGQAAELSPLSLDGEPELRSVLQELADQLGAPLDPRCLQPLRSGQRQHFKAA